MHIFKCTRCARVEHRHLRGRLFAFLSLSLSFPLLFSHLVSINSNRVEGSNINFLFHTRATPRQSSLLPIKAPCFLSLSLSLVLSRTLSLDQRNMAARDDSNIFDFYSNLMSNEPDMSSEIASASYFALDAGASNTSFHEGFPEWSSFSRFCKSLIHSIFQNLGAKGKEDLLERVKSCHSHEEIVSIADEEQIINITVDMLLQVSETRFISISQSTGYMIS